MKLRYNLYEVARFCGLLSISRKLRKANVVHQGSWPDGIVTNVNGFAPDESKADPRPNNQRGKGNDDSREQRRDTRRRNAEYDADTKFSPSDEMDWEEEMLGGALRELEEWNLDLQRAGYHFIDDESK